MWNQHNVLTLRYVSARMARVHTDWGLAIGRECSRNRKSYGCPARKEIYRVLLFHALSTGNKAISCTSVIRHWIFIMQYIYIINKIILIYNTLNELLNPLKHSGNYIYQALLYKKKICILPTQCICVSRMVPVRYGLYLYVPYGSCEVRTVSVCSVWFLWGTNCICMFRMVPVRYGLYLYVPYSSQVNSDCFPKQH
jgi:hypothetical protein